LKELTPGISSKADVTAVIGSPTARGTFDDNTWLYISEVTQPRIGRTLGELDQNVVVLNFDGQGVLQTVQKFNKEDALPVTVVARTTPSPGTEASFMQQLLGNIGRFNPAGAGASMGGGGGAPSPSR
jgi:outer membrane protein assembly factor BamE (lipoprotein component of BamABCDE complex)